MEIYNFEQRSPEWYEIRKGKMTASKGATIATAGAGLKTYILEIMSEYYSSNPKQTYINDDMQRGIELEAEAILEYELRNNVKTQEIGFVLYNEYFGASPDRLVNDDGLIEVKCPNDKTYLELLLTGKIKSEYLWQMQGQLLATNRKWCDFVAYNPNFEKNMFVKRILADKNNQDSLITGIDIGSKLIEEIKEKIKQV